MAYKYSPKSYHHIKGTSEIDSLKQAIEMMTVAVSSAHGEMSAQQKLANENEEKLRIITDSVLDAVIMMDSSGKTIYWNPAAEKIFGYSSEEISQYNIHSVLTPQRYRDKATEAHRQFIHTGEGAALGKTLELEAVRKDGTEFPIEISVSPIQVENKWCAVAVVRDITDRKQAELQLKNSEQSLKAIVESVPVGIVVLDTNRRICQINQVAQDMMGKSCSEDLIGHVCNKTFCPVADHDCPFGIRIKISRTRRLPSPPGVVKKSRFLKKQPVFG